VNAENIATPHALAGAMRCSPGRGGSKVLVLATQPDLEVVHPPIVLDPILTKHRFMSAIGAPRYIPTVFGGGQLENK
jgi:sulfopyruvate decarboxylase subunit beta